MFKLSNDFSGSGKSVRPRYPVEDFVSYEDLGELKAVIWPLRQSAFYDIPTHIDPLDPFDRTLAKNFLQNRLQEAGVHDCLCIDDAKGVRLLFRHVLDNYHFRLVMVRDPNEEYSHKFAMEEDDTKPLKRLHHIKRAFRVSARRNSYGTDAIRIDGDKGNRSVVVRARTMGIYFDVWRNIPPPGRQRILTEDKRPQALTR